MSSLAVNKNLIVVAKGLHLDVFDGSDHNVVHITPKGKPQAGDYIVDVIISADSKYVAIITALSKELILFDLPLSSRTRNFELPRSASKIRCSPDNSKILVADKSGDALEYDINSDVQSSNKILGHLSLLLDILQTNDKKYIITTDRDEKIKVSCYPNTYNIQTYCLGHKEFVNHIELLPHNDTYLLSTSGDGMIKIWNHVNGTICHTIETNKDVNDDQLKLQFIKSMDDDGIQVSALPVVHCAVAQLSDAASLVAVTIHTLNEILIYTVHHENERFVHKLKEKLTLEKFPTAIQFENSMLYVYDEHKCSVRVYRVSTDDAAAFDAEIKMFKELSDDVVANEANNSIKVLYKRKFDNVQEYQERKKLRLEKT